VQLQNLFANININTESSAKQTVIRVSNICQMRLKLMFTSCTKVLRRSRLVCCCQYYKSGFGSNRSVSSASSSPKPSLFLFAWPRNDTFFITNQVQLFKFPRKYSTNISYIFKYMWSQAASRGELFGTVHPRSLILSWKPWGKYRRHKEQRRSCYFI